MQEKLTIGKQMPVLMLMLTLSCPVSITCNQLFGKVTSSLAHEDNPYKHTHRPF